MIYVVRHGQTDLNKQRKMQGRLGLPLNETGLVQAERLKEELQNIRFDYVFSSPRHRAIQTARIISGMDVKFDPRLDVFDLGEADGLDIGDVRMDGIIPDSTYYKGIEDKNHFVQRVFSFMQDIEVEFENREINILIAGHRCTTGCIGAYFEGLPRDGNILRFSSDTGAYKTYTFK
jgi:uncharacterized phosphatase